MKSFFGIISTGLLSIVCADIYFLAEQTFLWAFLSGYFLVMFFDEVNK